jgi:hypothetical protein
MSATVSLEPASLYFFSDIVVNSLGQSQPLPPIQYTTQP